MQRLKQRERRKTQNNYTGSFHKPEVVLSPLHFQGEFTKKVIYDYNCSMLQLARDFKLLKHTSKRLLIKQNYKEVCLSLNT